MEEEANGPRRLKIAREKAIGLEQPTIENTAASEKAWKFQIKGFKDKNAAALIMMATT